MPRKKKIRSEINATNVKAMRCGVRTQSSVLELIGRWLNGYVTVIEMWSKD